MQKKTLVPHNHELFGYPYKRYSLTSGFLHHPIGDNFALSSAAGNVAIIDPPLEVALSQNRVNARVIRFDAPRVIGCVRYARPSEHGGQ